MADVEQRAESEAAAKGLSGQARKSYIGGVFNKIRQAHERATTPGARGRKLFNRRERVQARLDARQAMQPHREAIDVLRRQRNERIAAHQDEPRAISDATFADAVRRAVTKRENGSSFATVPEVREELRKETGLSDPAIDERLRKLRDEGDAGRAPLTLHFESDEDRMHIPQRGQLRYRDQDFDFISAMPSVSEQKRIDTENMQRMERERVEMFRAHGLKPPKQPAPERQRQRAIADAIKHGAPDFPPGTLAAAQGKPAAQPTQPAAMAVPTPPASQIDWRRYFPYATEHQIEHANKLQAARPQLAAFQGGTEKQGAWAARIRQEKLLDMEYALAVDMSMRRPNEERIARSRAGLTKAYHMRNPLWWIDHREDTGAHLMLALSGSAV